MTKEQELQRPFDILKEIRAFDRMQKRCFYLCLDSDAEFHRWRKETPFISWPSEWEVKFYPTHGTLLRGMVRLKSDHSRIVSFYLDGYDYLGSITGFMKNPHPYWEIYNISESLGARVDAGPVRFFMNDIEEFLVGISDMLHYKLPEKEDSCQQE